VATFKAYANGATMGRGNNAPKGGKRGKVDGWSRAAVRRHLQFLYSVDVPGLTGDGYGVTLTLRDTPPSHVEWVQLIDRLKREFRRAGLVRWHWVVEWQRRGTPHLHLAVYAPDGWEAPITDNVGAWTVDLWLRLAAPYGAGSIAQAVVPITGAQGWLKYLSKHASRGVAHYQRQGKPAGWESTGRLYGYGESGLGKNPCTGRWMIRPSGGCAAWFGRTSSPKPARCCWPHSQALRRTRLLDGG
jgi:hypothetical protein